MAQAVAAKWLLIGKMQAGTYEMTTSFLIRYWYTERLVATASEILVNMYYRSTIVQNVWMWFLGAK